MQCVTVLIIGEGGMGEIDSKQSLNQLFSQFGTD